MKSRNPGKQRGKRTWTEKNAFRADAGGKPVFGVATTTQRNQTPGVCCDRKSPDGRRKWPEKCIPRKSGSNIFTKGGYAPATHQSKPKRCQETRESLCSLTVVQKIIRAPGGTFLPAPPGRSGGHPDNATSAHSERQVGARRAPGERAFTGPAGLSGGTARPEPAVARRPGWSVPHLVLAANPAAPRTARQRREGSQMP